jgi:hypothetical protein
VSSEDQNKRRPRSADTDFFERLAELDRDLPVAGHPEAAAPTRPSGTGPAERRRSSAMAPRDPRPLIDLFPPVDEPEPTTLERSDTCEPDRAPPPADVLDEPVSEAARSSRRVVGVAAALLLLVAAGATAAAYLFRKDLAAILSAWQQTP